MNSDWNRPTYDEIRLYKKLGRMPPRFLPSDDDPVLSSGNCLKHGSYNARLLKCPLCSIPKLTPVNYTKESK